MAGSSSADGTSGLWTPDMGIRFEKTSWLWRRLCLPRFVQTMTGGAAAASLSSGEALGYRDGCDAGIISPQERQQPSHGSVDAKSAGWFDSREHHEAEIPGPDEQHQCSNNVKINAISTDQAHREIEVPVQEAHPSCQVHVKIITERLDSQQHHLDEVQRPDQAEPPDQDEPPFTMSPSLFDAARSAAPGSPESFWSHAMYWRTKLCGTVENVKVHYCTSQHTMEAVCQKHFLGQPVLGFDLEWLAWASRDSGLRENVSLIQIASPDRIALFHVALFPAADDQKDLLSPTFRRIMTDARVSKTGVSIRSDCTRLRNFFGLDVQGIFELSHLYKQVKYTEAGTPNRINKSLVSLSTQVMDVLKLPLSKDDAVRSSNWMQKLNHQQVVYSASDAYAGVQLYLALEEKRKALSPCPERPHHAELRLPIPRAKPEPPSSAHEDPSQPEDVRAVLIAAEELTTAYRATKKTVSARPASLKTYHVWQLSPHLAPADIARVLRDPPLQTSTVVGYILDAIVLESLPFDKARLKRDVLPLLHQRLREGRKYGALVRSCEGQQR